MFWYKLSHGIFALSLNSLHYTIDAFFEVNIRIWQPENSDVHRGEAEVNTTLEGWLILMLTEK